MDLIDQLQAELPSILETVPDLKETKAQHEGPCPFCGGNDRFFVPKNGKERFGCRVCKESGDKIDLHTMLHNCANLGELAIALDISSPRYKKKVNSTSDKTTKAARPARKTKAATPKEKTSLPAYIWQQSKQDDTTIREYLQSRGISILPLGMRVNNHKGQLSIVCQMQHNFANEQDPEPESIHLTRLKSGKKDGTLYQGSKADGILFYNDNKGSNSLVIGEGLETTLSAMEETGYSGMVSGDAGNMAGLSELHGRFSDVYILVDSDISLSGQKAAVTACKRIGEKNRCSVRLVTPDNTCFSENPAKLDFNNLTQEQIKERFKEENLLSDNSQVVLATVSRKDIEVETIKANSGVLAALRPASKITPKKIEWLWNPMLAMRKFHLLAARGGSAKTSIACDLAARITTGGAHPVRSSFVNENFDIGSVLFITTEDDPEDTLLPRFLAAGGDSAKLTFLSSSEYHLDIHERPGELEAIIDNLPDDLSLVILDPVTAMTGDANTHLDSIVKRLSGVLSGLAMKYNLSILGIIHFRKGDPTARGQSLVDMVTGSAGWVNSARIALACFVDDKTETGYFGVIKSNIGHKKYTLEYRVIINDEIVEIDYQSLQTRNIEGIIREIAARENKESKKETMQGKAVNLIGRFFTEHSLDSNRTPEPAEQKKVRNYVKEMIGCRISLDDIREAEKKGGYTSKPGGKGGAWMMHPLGCECKKCSF